MATLIQYKNGKYGIKHWFQYIDKKDNYLWCTIEYAEKYASFDTEQEALQRWEDYKKPRVKIIRRWLW